MSDVGGGASRSTDPAAGTSSATDISLREFIYERFRALEQRLDERHAADKAAVAVAKETADAALLAHNQLIRQMRDQAGEAQRQLDKLTDTYATKENLKTLEVLLNQRLTSIDDRLGSIEGTAHTYGNEKQAVRLAFSDLRSVFVFGFIVMGGVIGLITYLSQN
jgi:predicted  nucleic acid-binding Zn-ribbon protein